MDSILKRKRDHDGHKWLDKIKPDKHYKTIYNMAEQILLDIAYQNMTEDDLRDLCDDRILIPLIDFAEKRANKLIYLNNATQTYNRFSQTDVVTIFSGFTICIQESMKLYCYVRNSLVQYSLTKQLDIIISMANELKKYKPYIKTQEWF